MADVQIYFLDPINIFLGKPQYGSSHAAMLESWNDLPEEALRAAAEKVCENIRGKSAPNIKELKKHLTGARHKAEVYHAARVGPDPWDFEAQQRLHFAKRKQACFMCRCNLGRRADKEGWLGAMIDFAEDHGRIPEGREIDACIVTAKRSESKLHDQRGTPMYNSLVTLRLNMLERASLDVFGEEAIKRTPDKTLMTGSQGRRAGSSAGERQQANAKLQELENDYEPLSASPLLKKALGLPTRGRTERKFEQGIDGSE